LCGCEVLGVMTVWGVLAFGCVECCGPWLSETLTHSYVGAYAARGAFTSCAYCQGLNRIPAADSWLEHMV
jgi:hypothetical protein